MKHARAIEFDYTNLLAMLYTLDKLISCSPNLPRVYIRLCKHGNHFIFLQQCLYLQNNTLTLWNSFCSFSRDLVYGTRWTSLPFCKFLSVINDVTLLWTTTVLNDKLDISLRPSKSTEQTQRDIANFSPLPCGLFRGFYKLKPKLVSVTN